MLSTKNDTTGSTVPGISSIMNLDCCMRCTTSTTVQHLEYQHYIKEGQE